jgi:hypothetical protein
MCLRIGQIETDHFLDIARLAKRLRVVSDGLAARANRDNMVKAKVLSGAAKRT